MPADSQGGRRPISPRSVTTPTIAPATRAVPRGRGSWARAAARPLLAIAAALGLALLPGCEVAWGVQVRGTIGDAARDPADAPARARGEVAVAYVDLITNTRVGVREDLLVHAASTMKVPVMIQVFRDVDAGRLDLDAPVDVKATFASIVDGSPYDLDAADDSDATLYEAVGTRRPLRDLVTRMVTRSSNLATNLLIELVDAKRIQRTIEGLGTTRMQVLRGVEDGKAYRAGMSNTATAADLATLLAAIARGEAASPDSCRAMLAILEAQEFDDLIPAGLPTGTRVLHKTGWITGILHDAAIVVPEDAGAYVLVVLTRGYEDRDAAAARIANVARAAHVEHLQRHRGRAAPGLLARD